MKSSRLKAMEHYIIQNENASIDTLCSLFKVSKNTIRRDISELEKKGIAKKVYGGITINTDNKSTIPFEQREIEHIKEKQHIAELASTLVEDGDIVFIDSGTTTFHMLPYLNDKIDLTIVTNNLNIIMKALPYSNLSIVSTGGSVYRKTNSLIGIESVNFLKNYNISKAFMATTGVSISKGITNSFSFEYEIKKAVVENSSEVIILADHSKLDEVSLKTYCSLDSIDCLVTDKLPSKDYIDFFKTHNVNLMTQSK